MKLIMSAISRLICKGNSLVNTTSCVTSLVWVLYLYQDDYEMLARMFSITCWPEAYTETQAYNEGVFQFIEVVNKWHSTKRNQTGPIIVIDKWVQLYIILQPMLLVSISCVTVACKVFSLIWFVIFSSSSTVYGLRFSLLKTCNLRLT